MNKFKGVVILMLVISYTLGGSPQLKPIMTIGDNERDDYIFFRIKSAVMSADGSIFIADSKGAFISKFDKNGNFIKRVGQRGKGPNDFLFPDNLQICDDRIYIRDFPNERIAYADLGLNKFEYYRNALLKHKTIDFTNKLIGSFRVLDKNKLLYSFFYEESGLYRFFFVDQSLKVSDTLLTYNPGNFQEKGENARALLFSLICFDVSRKYQRLLVARQNADNPIDFQIFAMDGKLLTHFQHKLPDDIESAGVFITAARGSQERFNVFMITSIHSYREYFLVFIEQSRNIAMIKDKKTETEPYCLIFDIDGRYVSTLPLEKTGEVFSISDDGHLLMQTIMDEDDETVKLTIYKLTVGNR